MKKDKRDTQKIIMEELKPDEKLKYEIATELGLLDKVLTEGWKSLTAKETGRIGGIMTKRKKQLQMEELNKET